VRWYKADLHIHSALSPCADLEMAPAAIVNRAVELGLDLIALTDHNSLDNTAVTPATGRKGRHVCLPGAEVQTMEEIHVVCLFPDDDTAAAFHRVLYAALPDMKNDPDYFGDQPVWTSRATSCDSRRRRSSTRWSGAWRHTAAQVQAHGGFCFPAHVDRATYSVLAQLGFIPDVPHFDALGISSFCNTDELLRQHHSLGAYTLLRNSDAHFLVDIGRGYSMLYIQHPSPAELRLACRREEGRKVKLNGA
jgi:PHP family Zn ribbon phosphoesterase